MEFLVRVHRLDGVCPQGYQEGDEYRLTGLKTPEGFCGAAYVAMFPALFALNFGGSVPNGEGAGTALATCPDRGICTFLIQRTPTQAPTGHGVAETWGGGEDQ